MTRWFSVNKKVRQVKSFLRTFDVACGWLKVADGSVPSFIHSFTRQRCMSEWVSSISFIHAATAGLVVCIGGVQCCFYGAGERESDLQYSQSRWQCCWWWCEFLLPLRNGYAKAAKPGEVHCICGSVITMISILIISLQWKFTYNVDPRILSGHIINTHIFAVSYDFLFSNSSCTTINHERNTIIRGKRVKNRANVCI